MNKWIITAVLNMVILLLSACSNQIDTVKEGYLKDYPEKTIVDAFENYRLYQSTAWREQKDTDGQHFVELQGVYNLEEYRNLCEFFDDSKSCLTPFDTLRQMTDIHQFRINEDGTITLLHTKVVFEFVDDKKAYGARERFLTPLYRNENAYTIAKRGDFTQKVKAVRQLHALIHGAHDAAQ